MKGKQAGHRLAKWRRATWTKGFVFASGDDRGTFQSGGPVEQRHFLASEPTEHGAYEQRR